MVHQAQPHHDDVHIEEQDAEISVPTWSKIVAPVVAFSNFGLSLLYLYTARLI